ncbi:hypothetical protein [Zooshikella ganghwensis]|uniref:Iron-containing redox enzyme family protein n=1 Tax=Zooshikella ganghwensis TaxID=202772 RepID=A0A4P9VUC0_9GAMM|nr:hypothetical protein [Zooshikella ganghwensis]RDH45912.1 hypothetical protein B9G39_22010 [Zooshikella ganghwensis]
MDLTTYFLNNNQTFIRKSLARNRFFVILERGAISQKALSHVLTQFQFWSNQRHTWYAVAIAKSGCKENTLSQPTLKALVSQIQHLIFGSKSDIAEQCLSYLNISASKQESENEISFSTLRYSRWFMQHFAIENRTFPEAIASLAVLELAAVHRDQLLLSNFQQQFGISISSEHAEHYESDGYHIFEKLMEPLITHYLNEDNRLSLLEEMHDSVIAHLAYWDNLLDEAERNTKYHYG